MFLNTQNNPLSKNFEESAQSREKESQVRLEASPDPEGKVAEIDIKNEWNNYKYVFKLVRLDLRGDDYENESPTIQQSPNLTRLYQKGYAMLKKYLRKNDFTPCVVNNLQHSIHVTKESEQVYIFFQMTVSKQGQRMPTGHHKDIKSFTKEQRTDQAAEALSSAGIGPFRSLN